MNGYMDLFLETGDPAFYILAKQENAASDAAACRLENPAAEEGASPR